VRRCRQAPAALPALGLRAARLGPGCVAVLAVLALVMQPAWADMASTTGALPRTVGVDLRFQLSIDKVLYFRIGDGALPGVGGTTSTVAFSVGATIPAQPTTPANGNNTAVNWSGAAPSFAVTSSGNVLPVEVRSNAGQVTLRASVTTPLSNGAVTIPMSDIGVASSDAALPAPAIPATGIGTAVNVTGGGAGAINSLVTLRSANWTFSLAGGNYAAGSYNGQVTFIASTP
jgi:hypothetical protein